MKNDGIFDSGCTSSIIRADSLPMDHKVTNKITTYNQGSNQPLVTKGSTILNIQLKDFSGSRMVLKEFNVSKELIYPIVLGLDFIEDQKLIFNYRDQNIDWDELL